MGYEKPLTGAQRVAKRRAALRAQGLRPKTFWLPDTSTPEFQAQALRFREYLWERASEEAEIMAFVEAATNAVFEDLDRAEAEAEAAAKT